MGAELLKGINRRSFLLSGAAMIVGGCSRGIEKLNNGQDELLHREIHGDEVFQALPGIPVTVKGWSISITHDALRKSTSDNSEKVSVTLTDRDEKIITNVTSQNGNILVNDNDVSKSGLDKVKWEYFYATEQPFLLLASKGSAGRFLTRDYNIKFKSYHENLSDHDKPFIFSETSLPKDTLDKLAETGREFYPYIGYISTNINDSENEGGQYYNIRVKKIIIDRGCFEGPGLMHKLESDFGLQSQFHELSHVLFENFERGNFGRSFKKAFDKIDSAAGLDRGSNDFQKDADESKIWNMFDESSYILQKNKSLSDEDREEVHAFGHPYDNERELFASTMTVLRFYAPEFINRYQKLSNSGYEKAVRNTVSLALQQVRSMGSEDDFQRLLPQNARILQSLNLK